MFNFFDKKHFQLLDRTDLASPWCLFYFAAQVVATYKHSVPIETLTSVIQYYMNSQLLIDILKNIKANQSSDSSPLLKDDSDFKLLRQDIRRKLVLDTAEAAAKAGVPRQDEAMMDSLVEEDDDQKCTSALKKLTVSSNDVSASLWLRWWFTLIHRSLIHCWVSLVSCLYGGRS